MLETRWRRILLLGLACVLTSATAGRAATIRLQTNMYEFDGDPDAVVIQSRVDDMGALYLWEYTVTNNSYDPIPGTTNGFSGFELALPGGFVPDLDNVVNPNANWENNCCSGLPMEWDIRNTGGPGIMPGGVGIFSFTTLPRLISTADAGWFHTWDDDIQAFIVNYGENNAPLAPDLVAPVVEIPGIPEPTSLLLLGTGLAAARLRRRRRRA